MRMKGVNTCKAVSLVLAAQKCPISGRNSCLEELHTLEGA